MMGTFGAMCHSMSSTRRDHTSTRATDNCCVVAEDSELGASVALMDARPSLAGNDRDIEPRPTRARCLQRHAELLRRRRGLRARRKCRAYGRSSLACR